MNFFDKNIHMNGAGTTYQAFLDLADAAERKGGTIGNRTVRLVKDGDRKSTRLNSTNLNLVCRLLLGEEHTSELQSRI